jgi:integrase
MNFTREELDSLFATARKHDVRDYWMLMVTWNHGLRVSETLALTRDNFSGGNLAVRRLKGSEATLQPVLPAESAETRIAFMEFVTATEGRLFPIHRATFWRRIQDYGKEAGLATEKCHPHILKHSCGRLSYEGGMGIPEIQKWLGHVNGKNTLVYMESTQEKAAAAFAAACGR